MSDPIERPPDARMHTGLFLAGILFSLVAAFASLGLVMHHLGGLALPGCQAGSACDQAANSVWGKIPGIGWPVSFVGLAYFVGALIAWIGSRITGPSSPFKNIVRLGVIISLVYVVVIAIHKHYCLYCMITHAANFAFWLVVESAPIARGRSDRALPTVAGSFVAVTLVLGLVQFATKKEIQAQGEKKLVESTKEIIESTKDPAGSKAQPVTVSPQVPAKSPSQIRWPGGFTGRHRMGPEKAPIRLVVLSDYQCPDCQRIEQDISAMMVARPDVSVSFKYFPMCTDCNMYIHATPQSPHGLHPNACWAARAAEAAAILGGDEGFWKVHRWLWDVKGFFSTQEELQAAVGAMGFDQKKFVKVMTDNTQTLPAVLTDVEDGNWLGLYYTPMIFINGVELKGIFTPGAVPRAVEAVAATHPPAAGPENDFPPPAEKKFIDDWLEKPVSSIPVLPWEFPLGPDDAKAKIVVWGDLVEPNTAKMDQLIRGLIAKGTSLQYRFHDFPIDPACNPSSQITRDPRDCLAHRAVQAAGMLAGADGYWKMHNWIIDNQSQFSEETLKQNAFQMGFDVNALFEKMKSQEVSDRIMRDGALAKQFGLTAVPWLFLNSRFVPRWIRGTEVLLDKMIERAIKGM